MTDPQTLREQAREHDGRFGAQQHTAPAFEIPSPPSASPRIVSTTLPVSVTTKGWLGREKGTVHDVTVETLFHATSSHHTLAGERGERIVSGQAHLPVMRDGSPVEASAETLEELVRAYAATADGGADSVAGARDRLAGHIRGRARDLLIIDGQLWAKASRVQHVGL